MDEGWATGARRGSREGAQAWAGGLELGAWLLWPSDVQRTELGCLALSLRTAAEKLCGPQGSSTP